MVSGQRTTVEWRGVEIILMLLILGRGVSTVVVVRGSGSTVVVVRGGEKDGKVRETRRVDSDIVEEKSFFENAFF